MQFTLPTKEQRLRANNMLTQAIEIAELLKDNRAIAYAKSYMAQLYAQEDRYPEAVQLIREAIHYAHNPNTVTVKAVQNVISNEHCTPNTQYQNCLIETGFRSYPELLYSLEWQLGKLLKQASEYQKTAKMYKEVAFEQAQRQVIIDAYQRAKTYLRSVREQYRCGGESQPFLEPNSFLLN